MIPATEGVQAAETIARSQYVFGIMFIILFVVVLWGGKILLTSLLKKVETMHTERTDQLTNIMNESKEESREREQNLINHNNSLVVQMGSQNSLLGEITETQKKMQDSLGNLQESFAKIEVRIEKIESTRE